MIRLDAERCLALTPRKARRLVCHSGVLWATREGDLRDFFLTAGDVLEVRGGLMLVTALERASLTIERPEPWWRLPVPRLTFFLGDRPH